MSEPLASVRSLLYVPASNPRMIERAAERGADLLILDLEDGVHPERKEDARSALAEARRRLTEAGARVAVRVNGPDTPWWSADLDAVWEAGFETIVLPKVEEADPIFTARSRSIGPPPLLLMIETAAGMARVFHLSGLTGVAGLIFGSADYGLSLGLRASGPASTPSPGPAPDDPSGPSASPRSSSPPEPDETDPPALAHARQRLLLAARAAGVRAFDAPHFAFRDHEGTTRAARRAARRGFDGMTAVHPTQIPLIHAAFAPTPAERHWAERVISTMESATTRGRAVTELDGQLLEPLHLEQAHRLLRGR